MASFGEKLRQARESRKITLQEIADTTKIGTRALQALESNRFDQLPGGIFNKGFVRSYARFVGLDEEKMVAEYIEAANADTPEIDMEALSAQVAAAKPPRESWTPNAGSVVGVLAVVVALGTGALWLNEHRKEAREAAEQSRADSMVNATQSQPALPSLPIPAVPPTTTATPAGATPAKPTNTGALPTDQSGHQNAISGVTAPEPAKNPPVRPRKQLAAPVEVSISATAKAWISVHSDGKEVESLVLDPDNPETRSRNYSANEKLLLVVGNAAGLSVTYNGKPAGTLGEEGKRATITFTPEGMEKQ